MRDDGGMTTVAASDRALGALQGLALGDALGMPTQSMTADEIRSDYGAITGFVAAGPRQRIAHGMPAASITDDTEQALLVARLLIDGDGVLEPRIVADALDAWERGMAAKGSLDLLGPSTKAAIEAVRRGVPPETAGAHGTTNGAAMRIAPVGIATPLDDLPRFVAAVAAACRVTHDTSVGIAGAAAIAAAVSAGVDGSTRSEALTLAIEAARIGARHGTSVPGDDVATRLERAFALVGGLGDANEAELAHHLVDDIGTTVATRESVVAALALVSVSREPWRTLCLAASLGGDTDTIAAMAGAVLGALGGTAAWPADAAAEVVRVNALDLPPLVDGLLALRTR